MPKTRAIAGGIVSGGVLMLALAGTVAAQAPSPAPAPDSPAPAQAAPKAPAAPEAPKLPDHSAVFESDKVEVVASGLRFTEGPVFRDGVLYFSDIPTSTVHTLPAQAEDKPWRTGTNRSNGLAFDASGRLIACESDGAIAAITIIDGKPGERKVLVSAYEGKRLNSPNDLAIHPDGSIYFTDPDFFVDRDKKQLDFNGIFRLGADGGLTLVSRAIARPNGLAFSPDHSRLYVTDSASGSISSFTVDADGAWGEPKPFASVRAGRARGLADGIKVDGQGRVFSTGAGGIFVFTTDGTLIAFLSVPGASNLCFGDADGRTLYITKGREVVKARVREATAPSTPKQGTSPSGTGQP
ncbi:MAG: SMP-30/gluconolactonase/LRE family protein [Phycisphaerales bacterium]|jgi:sugar lactone lactonase YvrE|nr:SMP-30/gluconolactonase/LRE family protein [Phycisphaeraceae bacterium]